MEKTRRLLEAVRERVDYAIGRLKAFEEAKALSWRYRKCGHTKKFTKPVPGQVAAPCLKCRGAEFDPG